MLIEPLIATTSKGPNDIAIKDDGGSHTYQQLSTFAAEMGAFLAGQTQQNKVGLLLPSGIGFVASFYGTLLAGKSVVPINFLLGEREIKHVIADSGIDTIVSVGPLAAKMQGGAVKVIDLGEVTKGGGLSAYGGVAARLFADGAPQRSTDDLAVLMYTSGTSGLPKGVKLTFGNLQSDVDAAIEHAQLKHKHVFLGVIPLFHAFGMTAMMLAPVQLGATIIYHARFSAVAAMNAIRQEGASLIFAVPSMFGAIAHLKNAGPEDFKNTYALISGGEPLPSKLREGFLDRFKVPILEGYGLTETSPVVTLNVPHSQKAGSVGKPVPGAQIRITDENGKAMAVGESGEVWLRGPMIMKGYNNLPAETEAALTPDGFFKTGDLGMIDADGFLHITGRKKDLIIVAGEKAAPREIEEVLMKHPTVAEAAVVGKKDPGRGEVVVAFVMAVEGKEIVPDELREFCRQQALPQWKIPREIFVEKDLPRSPTGKVLKRVLADRANSQGNEKA